MRITKTTCFLFGVALLGVGFYALIEHNAETALRGNARTLYALPLSRLNINQALKKNRKSSRLWKLLALLLRPRYPKRRLNTLMDCAMWVARARLLLR